MNHVGGAIVAIAYSFLPGATAEDAEQAPDLIGPTCDAARKAIAQIADGTADALTASHQLYHAGVAAVCDKLEQTVANLQACQNNTDVAHAQLDQTAANLQGCHAQLDQTEECSTSWMPWIVVAALGSALAMTSCRRRYQN